ncbi:MAG: methyltransferase [Alphaproteobacteria bacterium]
MKYEAPTTDDRRIWDLFLSHTYVTSMVAGDESGIYAALNEGPDTIEGLAKRLSYDVRATGVLLRHLASLGVLNTRNGVFQVSELARQYLIKSSPYYWGNMLRIGANAATLTRVLATLKEKDSANRGGPEGTPVVANEGRPAEGWASGKITIDQAHSIAAAMHSHSMPAAIGAARNYDFKGVKKILDVGGGSGCFMIAMAQANPSLKCTIMELNTMCEVATTYIKNGGVGAQVDTIAVDMFREAWPKGYDAMFFSNVFHDWNFRTCEWLAKKCYDALEPGGRIMLHEQLIDDDGCGPATTTSFSMLMLIGTQGQQFTFNELKMILEKAGFRDVEAKHTAGYYSITTGYKR